MENRLKESEKKNKENNMKKNYIYIIASLILMTSCAVIPKETVSLSKNIGQDLQTLHSSHVNIVQLYYGKIKNNINTFIDDVYSPYIIHFVLESELRSHKEGKSSIYTSIEKAGTIESKENTDEALNVMLDFYEAAISQINMKRDELLSPIIKQEAEILNAINESYENILYANTTLTAYLSSARKVKETQDKALSLVGFDGLNDKTTEKLVELSNVMDEALKKSEQIDIKSTEAQKQIEGIIEKLKNSIK